MSIVKQLIDYIILNPFGWLFRTLLIQSGIELCIHYGYAIADRIGNLRKVYTPQNLIINVFLCINDFIISLFLVQLMLRRFFDFDLVVTFFIGIFILFVNGFGLFIFHFIAHFFCVFVYPCLLYISSI